MKRATISVLFVMSICFSTNTFALNDREQGLLIGALIAGLLVGKSKDAQEKQHSHQHEHTHVRPPVVIIQRSQCYHRPFYNDYGVYVGQKFECRYD